jgi:hypothetical protein
MYWNTWLFWPEDNWSHDSFALKALEIEGAQLPSEFHGVWFRVITGQTSALINKTQSKVSGYAIIHPEIGNPFITSISIENGLIGGIINPFGVKYLWNSLDKVAYFPQFWLQLTRSSAESLSTFAFCDTQYLAFKNRGMTQIIDYNGRWLIVDSFSREPLTRESSSWHLAQVEESMHRVLCTPTWEPEVDGNIPVRVKFFPRGPRSSSSPIQHLWFVRYESGRVVGIKFKGAHFLRSIDENGRPQMIDFANPSSPITLYSPDIIDQNNKVSRLKTHWILSIPLIAQYSWPKIGIYMRTLGGFNVGPFPLIDNKPQIQYFTFGDFVGWKTPDGMEFAKIVDGDLEWITLSEQKALESIVRAGSMKFSR